MRHCLVFYLILVIAYHLIGSTQSIVVSPKEEALSGFEALTKGKLLLKKKNYEEAAGYIWHAILHLDSITPPLDAKTLLEMFLSCYSARGVLYEGYEDIARQYFDFRQFENGFNYLETALNLNPNSFQAHRLWAVYADVAKKNPEQRIEHLKKALKIEPRDQQANLLMGNYYWEKKSFKSSLQHFDRAYAASVAQGEPHNQSLSNAIYIRTSLCQWGVNGATYDRDMRMVEEVVRAEMDGRMKTFAHSIEQASVVFPHMALAYPLPSALKLVISQSHANAERALFSAAGITPTDHYSPQVIKRHRKAFSSKHARIRIGYVSASMRSKAIIYLTQGIFDFHDRSKFEVHIFATSPPDSEEFILQGMRGIDWRKRIKNTVEFFHEVAGYDAIRLRDYILSLDIHILLDWDGYSNNGIRSTGLFSLQPAPLAINHQEFLGSIGGNFTQYIITDKVASPPSSASFHTEKFIWMPHCFFINSFPQLRPPLPVPTRSPQTLPQELGCGGEPASFVYCNFNKHAVEGSVLCLSENPKDSVMTLMNYVRQFDASLASRVRFLPQTVNPYDNLQREIAVCNVALDPPFYGSHTTAVDALWSAIPLVTFNNGTDMSSRTAASMLTTLKVPELIASSAEEYELIAIKLGRDGLQKLTDGNRQENFYAEMRNRLFDALEARNPRNPMWDLNRYVRNFESGLMKIWKIYLAGEKPRHVEVQDVNMAGDEGDDEEDGDDDEDEYYDPGNDDDDDDEYDEYDEDEEEELGNKDDEGLDEEEENEEADDDESEEFYSDHSLDDDEL